MRVLASLSTVAATVILASCGLDMGGLGDVGSAEGGPTLDGFSTAEGGSSSSGSSGGSSSGSDGATDGTMGPGDSGSSSGADSTAPPDSSMVDSGSPKDSSVADTFVADTYVADTYVADTYVVETAPPCTTANGCYVVPSGWTLVPFAPSQSAACPSGFANAQPENLVELPITGGCACAACTNGTPPTCTGALSDYYDDPKAPLGPIGGTNCGAQGSPPQNNNSPAGQCGTDLYTGTGLGALSYKDFSLKYVPPTTLTGGTCTSNGAVSGTPTFAAQDRACTPDNAQSGGCNGNQCTPTFPSPYQVCIAMGGSQTCPAVFTSQHTVGASANYTCSSCGCTAGGTCNGGTMKLFTDNACKNGELDIPADGNCHASNAKSDSYGSYIYAANPPQQITCQSTGTSSPQGASLQSVQTICCVP